MRGNLDDRAFMARPKSWPERWSYLVSEARRILASPSSYAVSEVRWAEDVLTVQNGAHAPRINGDTSHASRGEPGNGGHNPMGAPRICGDFNR